MSISLRNPLKSLLKTHPTVVLDGALATLLESRGCDLNHALWSAKILTSQPELIQQVHYDYFAAGADIAITASYQATPSGLRDAYGYTEEQSSQLIAKSVHLAQAARAQILADHPERRMLVAGSVGPYGAYLADGSEYRGDYSLPDAEMRAFHRGRISALVDAGVDILACETLPSLAELQALLGLLQDEFPQTAAWMSFTLRDEGHISDGTSLEDICAAIKDRPQVVAIGVNCVAQEVVGPALRRLRSTLGTQMPLVAYPNSGEVYDAEEKVWHSRGDASVGDLRDLVKGWITDGAALVGGCCRTSPSDIRIIYDVSR